MPSAYGGDNVIRVGGPDERFWLHIVLFQEAVDRSLEIEDRMEHAPFQSATVSKGAASLHGHVPSHLLHPLRVRVNGDPGDVHLAALEMDEKQHVVGHQSS